jgi:hypothetical protein
VFFLTVVAIEWLFVQKTINLRISDLKERNVQLWSARLKFVKTNTSFLKTIMFHPASNMLTPPLVVTPEFARSQDLGKPLCSLSTELIFVEEYDVTKPATQASYRRELYYVQNKYELLANAFEGLRRRPS